MLVIAIILGILAFACAVMSGMFVKKRIEVSLATFYCGFAFMVLSLLMLLTYRTTLIATQDLSTLTDSNIAIQLIATIVATLGISVYGLLFANIIKKIKK